MPLASGTKLVPYEIQSALGAGGMGEVLPRPKQWIGEGGDSLRFGFDSLWITDYKKGLLSRIPIQEVK